ncbi:MAG: PspC domain-containing protein [Calditrichaeota bacterium]|nr:PspC domain-containing protein [Calditrichota bacterium]
MKVEGKPTFKRLYRSEEDRLLAGICGGLGEYFSIDPVIIRLIWIFSTFATGGMCILLYLLCWIVIPRQP